MLIFKVLFKLPFSTMYQGGLNKQKTMAMKFFPLFFIMEFFGSHCRLRCIHNYKNFFTITIVAARKFSYLRMMRLNIFSSFNFKLRALKKLSLIYILTNTRQTKNHFSIIFSLWAYRIYSLIKFIFSHFLFHIYFTFLKYSFLQQ